VPHTRASWVALRTLGRRINAVVGETHGMPVYSIDGVHVVLPPGTRHFRRVIACERCHLGVVDPRRPVRRRSDLFRTIEVTCERCSQLSEWPTGSNAAVTRRESWFTLQDAAEYLSIPMRTMYDLVGRREIHTTGWPMRIAWSELEDFVRRSRLKPGSLRHLYSPGDEDDDAQL
jgi:hypothetical protein